jgi:circadian clock protein KaiB
LADLLLKLYVAGRTPASLLAMANLRRLCDQELRDCQLVVIDVLERPQLAEGAKIMATPTLVKEQPEPARRIIGDLSDTRRLLQELGLAPRSVSGDS